MASAPGILIGGVAGSAAGHNDALKRNFHDLKSRSPEVRATAARSIRQFLEQEAQERSGEGFVRVLNSLQSRIAEYGASLDPYEKLGCILLIDELVLLAVENEMMVIRFTNQLSIIIREQVLKGSVNEMDVLGAATRALGHLARSGSPGLTYDLLEHEVLNAINWMKAERHEMSRHAAMMIITELSKNAPALFYNHVITSFFDYVWNVLCDPKLQVRVRAALALRSVLLLVSHRQPDMNQQKVRKHNDLLYMKARQVFPSPGGDWTNKKKARATPASNALNQGQRGAPADAKAAGMDPFHPLHREGAHHHEFSSSSGDAPVYDYTNIASVHAALLTFYELLDPQAGVSNMDQNFIEILQDCVWRDEILYHKDPLILHHVIALFPRLAQFCPNDMMANYLAKVVKYLLDMIRISEQGGRANDRSAAFRALGQLSAVPRVGKWFAPHVVGVVEAIHTGVYSQGKKTSFCEEALECLEVLVRSQNPYGLSDRAKEEIRSMVGVLFMGGLSEPLVLTLMTLGKAIPSLLPTLRHRLLAEITLVLGQAGNSLSARGSIGSGGSAGVPLNDPTGSSQKKNRSWFGFSSSSSAFTVNARERLLLATNKALEQRLGLFSQSADPYLIATLQGVIDNSPPHPAANAVAEATASLNLKNAFTKRKKEDPALNSVSQQELDTYRQRLALRTLGTFDFTGVTLLPLVMAAVVQFLESVNVGVRHEAVIACCRLLSSAANLTASFTSKRRLDVPGGFGAKTTGNQRGSDSIFGGTGRPDTVVEDYRTAADYVVERLVVMALTDSDVDIRCRVVEELDSRKFRQMMLENPENLRSLFVLVNDQHFGVRSAAMVAIGHLAELAPSYVVPSLRTVLVRLLTELDFGGDLRHREESAALLGVLVQSLDPPLARPHVDSMLKGLLPKLQDSNTGAASAMMAALGEVATVARDALLPHVGKILSVAMDVLDERSTHGFLEREVALHTLSKVCKSTIMSIWPYFFRRKLLDMILQVMVSSSSPWPVRRQAMIALGTLGALDPWLHKKNQRENQTLLALGEEFASDLFMATCLESVDFAYQRFSLASPVFEYAFGGGTYDSDEEDEFETELAEDFFAAGTDTKTGGNGQFATSGEGEAGGAHGVLLPAGSDLRFSAFPHTSKTQKHWLLASKSTDTFDDSLDEAGADLDVVYPVATAYETGKRTSLTGARGSGGFIRSAAGAGGGGGLEGEQIPNNADPSATPRGLRQQRQRRSSIQHIAAAVAPAATSAQSTQNPAMGRVMATHHRRRSSQMMLVAHAASGSDMFLNAPKDSSEGELVRQQDNNKKNQSVGGGRSHLDRVQRLRALASGARLATGAGEDDQGVFGLDPSTILPSMVPGNYYSTVSVTALVRVLNDPTALAHRKMSVVAILHIFDFLKKHRGREGVAPFLPHVVPSILRIAKVQLALPNATVEQRTWPLEEIGKLVTIVQRDFRAYLPQTFELTQPYYGDQFVLTEILALAHTVATNLEAKSLQLYVPNLLPEMLGILRTERENPDLNWTNTPAVLGTIASLGSALGDYLYLVMPMLMRLVDQNLASNGMVRLDIRVRAVETLSALMKKCDIADYSSRLLHPLCRALSDCHLEGTTGGSFNNVPSPRHRLAGGNSPSGTSIRRDVNARSLFIALMDCLTNLVFRLEEEYAVYVPMVEEALQHSMREANSQGSKALLQFTPVDLEQIEYYRSLVQRVLRGHALPKPTWYNPQLEDEDVHDEADIQGLAGVAGGASTIEDEASKKKKDAAKMDEPSTGKKLSTTTLKKVWETSQRSTEEDWIEWMRRFSLELLKNSPSYALESCATLAQVHEPLAHDLFYAAFAAVWGELCKKSYHPKSGNVSKEREEYDKQKDYDRMNLIASLNHAFKSHLPKEILQTLLNLAEFMEHDDKPLPLDMRVLGELAYNTQAYAKSLHYKEIEFKTEPEQVVEKLIQINKNLDQVNAAIGVVEYIKRHNAQVDFEQQPSWYAQLGRWDEALDAYDLKYHKLRDYNSVVSINPVYAGLSSEEIEVNQGRMECLKALGEWDLLAKLADERRLEIRDMRRQAKKAAGKVEDADNNDDDIFLGLNGMQEASFGSNTAAQREDNKSQQAAFSSSYLFDRLGGGSGDHIRPVSILMKNTNRAASSAEMILANTMDGTGRNGTGVHATSIGPGEQSSGPQALSGSSASLVRRVSYLDPQSMRGTPPPRRSQSGLALNEMGVLSRATRQASDATNEQDRIRYGQMLDHYDHDMSPVSKYFQEVTRLGAYANWMLRRWSSMKTYVQVTSENTYDGNFLRAVLDIHYRKLDNAEARVEAAYRKLGQEVTSNFGESYSRAYGRIVRVQELAELQELISYLRLEQDGRREEAKQEIVRLKLLWRQRLQGVQQNVDVLLPILAVRSMVVEPKEDIDTWLNFAKVARKQGRKLLSLKALMNLGIGSNSVPRHGDEYDDDDDDMNARNYDDDDVDGNNSFAGRRGMMGGGEQMSGMATLVALHDDDMAADPSPLFPQLNVPSQRDVHPRVAFAYFTHLWTFGTRDMQKDAVSRLKKLSNAITESVASQGGLGEGPMEYVGDIPALNATFNPKSRSPSSVLPSSSAAPGANGGPSMVESLGSSRRRSSNQPRAKSKLSMVTRSTDLDIGEDLAEALKKVPLEQRRRLAVRCNCQLGEWVLALNTPEAAAGVEAGPVRSTSIVRDLDSYSSPTPTSSYQTSSRARGMTTMPSFFRPSTFASSFGNQQQQQQANGSQTNTVKINPQLFAPYNDAIHEALGYYEKAIRLNSSSYRAWRLWALANFASVEFNEAADIKNSGRIVCAISGLFRSIDLGSEEMNASVLQDILRLLALWFRNDGAEADSAVSQALQRGMTSVPTTTWLEVIPQLIARVNAPNDLVCSLLRLIGRSHPQQLLFPLTVASNSEQNPQRSLAAQKIMQNLQELHPVLVEEARLVARELIRVAVLWPEMWHEGLEEASRLYYSPNRNIEQMIAALEPLHEKIENPGPETLSEVGFAHAFGRDLKEASEWLQAYRDSPNRGENLSYINQAWDLYYNVFKVISKQLDMKSLELRHVSPQLLHASGLQLAVPGRYVDATGEPIRIERFSPTLRVIKSKQRPRVITMHGSDGADHMFLLKGHEDLRLDERVMQLLGLVNNLLAGDGETHRADVEIQKYAVVPLSSRAGVMQWVPSCDTLHELIREYRDARKIPVNIEHRLIAEFAPQYESLLPVQKVEVFQHAIRETSGQDLAKVLWLKSANSETWLDRRTNFTRSLAAMSIVGYVLGLGDRHPSNLMCERASGRILHIDFGDCFEVAMHRDKYPEGVPFRLTRMLVNAMEVSGIEGNYRITCENVMRVLRANKESVMTMLSAFVHDPLITWRLFKPDGRPSNAEGEDGGDGTGGEKDGSETQSPTSKAKGATMSDIQSVSSRGVGGLASRVDMNNEMAGSYIGSLIERGVPRSYLSNATTAANHNNENNSMGGDKAAALNERAVEVIERVRAKLRGTDFDPTVQLDVKEQVDLLIRQAQSHENLAVLYSGWSAVW